MKKILIIGATSAIATACARIWAGQGASFALIARDEQKLEQVAADLRARGAGAIRTHIMDATDFAPHSAMLRAAVAALGQIDVALIAHGTLPDQKACERDATLAANALTVNATSVIALATAIADRLESQHSGTLAVISSVAGDRARASNYVYGSAKAAVNAFCEGLRARLATGGVHVLTIKPGFVDTPMTKGMRLPGALLATPDQVARDIVKAVERKNSVLYTPMVWALIMLIIRNIPDPIFRRLNL
ncbi:MAG: SDR family oxidoreductase [Alphaproteobacteria bacterium]|nr:SDR family oxidoreductase [Alphaproteobacteria bacterium]